MTTPSCSNGLQDIPVICSSLNTSSMSHTIETVDVNSEQGSSGRPEDAEGSPREVSSTSRGGDATETIARGLASVLAPVVRLFETRVEEVLKSQNTLERSIDRLTRELDKLLEDTPLPLGAQHAAKLSGIRKRVGLLTETLRVIQGRINTMDRMLSNGSVRSLH